MKNLFLCLLLLLPLICFAGKKKPKSTITVQEELLQKIKILEKKYATQQAKLQQLTEKRWSAKQKQVSVKENNKEGLDRLQQKMEHLYSDVARAREELLARENALDREKDIVLQKQLERDFFAQAINNKMEKESKENLSGFPLNQDRRIAALAKIDRSYTGKRFSSRKLKDLLDYKYSFFRESNETGIARRTFITDNSESVTAQILRLGNSMAYAMTPDADIYYLENSGKIGQSRFVWRRIENLGMATAIAEAFPKWIETHSIKGTLPIDILQNSYSSSLVVGEKQGLLTKAQIKLQQGGFVIYILGGLLLWAILLILNRLFVYSFRHKRSGRFMKEAVTLLSEEKLDKATALAKKTKGIQARILETCLKHSKWKRNAAEKSVKELLLTEIPKLDKFLDTLAVFAASAPLLGLLGTVTGMIKMFDSITRFGTGDPKLLAGGISEALITTEVGLIVAIPLLLIHNFLRNRRNGIQADMEKNAMTILNRLWPED